jgi:hypothetical protein
MSPVFEAMYQQSAGSLLWTTGALRSTSSGRRAGRHQEDLLGVVAEFRKVCASPPSSIRVRAGSRSQRYLYHPNGRTTTRTPRGWDFLGRKVYIAIIGTGVQV